MIVLKYSVKVYIVLTILTLLFLGVETLRIEWVSRRQDKVLSGVYKYISFCINHDITPQVWFHEIESFEDTCKRFWDLGYKRLLPKGKYEIIRGYMK